MFGLNDLLGLPRNAELCQLCFCDVTEPVLSTGGRTLRICFLATDNIGIVIVLGWTVAYSDDKSGFDAELLTVAHPGAMSEFDAEV